MRDKMVGSRSCIFSLGKTERERQKEYKRWFHESIPKGERNLIRQAIQRNWAYGNNRFKEKMENVLGRRFDIKKAGRRPKL